jgi:HK97 family phage prohead protease|nr:MAG TPA: major capsid protein [Caudoviricetes sp.]
MAKWDFGGWATKNNLRCSDERIIMKDAFKDNDGQTVPLVWNHQHNDPMNVLGHALLQNRPEGVRAYCKFNDTESGQNAKRLVENGDISALSIFANQLKQQGKNVTHGVIREVSLVLAGANPGARIDAIMQHADGSDDSAIIYTGESIDTELSHSDDEPKKEEPKVADNENKSVKDIYDSMTEEQKDVVAYMVGMALEGDAGNDDEEDNPEMKHNIFDNDQEQETNVLSHDAMMTIINDGKRYGSMKESFLAHADEYGIADIDWLFPEAKTLNNPPDFIKRETEWCAKLMNGVHKTPFSRIKSMFANITEDEARAKGYIKGKYKKEEVFSLLKRTTTPTTIYKKQKMDRDDVIDITDFDVIAWLKTEMRMMLDEEIARAILVGDGRLASSDDKINEQNIRPIWTDEDLFSVKVKVAPTAGATDEEKAKTFIKSAIKNRKNYKGSGNPILFTTEDMIADMLLIEDTTGRRIYNSISDLATTLRVREIVPVEIMEGLQRDVGSDKYDLLGIMVNPADYNVGADKGGAVSMFDDFDIDYNQQKYLMETRCSGALIKPYSALIFETKAA